MSVEKLCIACGVPYQARHIKKQKYCSIECGESYRHSRRYNYRKEHGLCLWCGKEKADPELWNCAACRSLQLSYGKRGAWRRAQLKHKYGLSTEDYSRMLKAQNGVCLICKGVNKGKLTGVPLGVDHDHTTNTVRGLLCSPCNSKLGWFEDNRDALLAYTNMEKVVS